MNNSLITQILTTSFIFSMAACKQAEEEKPALTADQDAALKDFRGSAEKTKETYKIEVERAKIDWNADPKEKKNQEKEE